jgi:hypothetical protein
LHKPLQVIEGPLYLNQLQKGGAVNLKPSWQLLKLSGRLFSFVVRFERVDVSEGEGGDFMARCSRGRRKTKRRRGLTRS